MTVMAETARVNLLIVPYATYSVTVGSMLRAARRRRACARP
ncbi:hypothetical protein [Mycobacterium senriense]|jgi:hypothetical protein|nr:hypothetical protein [Mycobacterium senriense]